MKVDNGEIDVVKRLYRSMIPIQALTGALPMLTSLLSTLIIGAYMGEKAMAAIGFISPLVTAVSAISGMIIIGSQLANSKYLGKGDSDGVRSSFNTSMLLCLVFGLIFCLLSTVVARPVAIALGAGGENTAYTVDYLRGMGVYMLLNFISSSLLTFLQLERLEKYCTISIVALLVINVVGNILNAVCFHGGMFGAGLVMSIGTLVSVILELAFILRFSKLYTFSPKSLRFADAKTIVYLGFPKAAEMLLVSLRLLIINKVTFQYLGSVGISAMSLFNNIGNIGVIVKSGVVGTVNSISSVLLSQRDSSTLRDIPRVTFKTELVCILCYFIAFFLAKPLAYMVGATPENIGIYVNVVRLASLWIIIFLFVNVPTSIYQAMGKIGMLVIVNIISEVVAMAIGLLLVGVWGAYPVIATSWTSLVVTYLVFFVLFRIKAHRFPRSPLELIYIPSTISAPRENRFKAVIKTTKDAADASAGARAFCLAKGLDKHKASCVALCIEEIGVDAIQYRFSKKNDSIDVRIIYEDGHIRLLLRDYCNHFNPAEWLALCNAKDEDRSLGIRLITGMTSDINYQSTLGLNVMTVII